MLHLRTFGGLALDRDGVPLAGAQRKSLALLAILAASSTKGVGRDRLMALLWPESDAERARGALKQTVHVLRQLLGSPEALLGNAELRLNPAIVTSDVASFMEAVVEGDAEGALRHYGGPFLDGVHIESSGEFERWAEETRADLARRRADAMERLANAATEKGDHAAAARWWQSMQASDPLSGRIAVKLMLAFEAAGDRSAALRHARVHAELLKQELGVEEDPDVRSLAERLATAPVARPLAPAAPVPAARDVAPPDLVLTARRRRLGALAVVAVPLLLAAAAAILLYRGPVASSLGSPRLDSLRVAVGIFENETGDSALTSLGTMAADWVVRGLARTGTVQVLDAATLYAQPSSGSREGALDLARRNGAGLAVAGRYYRERDSLVFTAAVYDVASSRVLHTLDPVRTTPNEVLSAVEELRQRLAAALVAQVDPHAPARFRGPVGHPPTLDAYREFVAAHEHYWRGRMDEGVEGFRRAARLDTTFLAAALWVITASVSVDRCDVADSVIRELETRRQLFATAEVVNIRATRSRCNRDWDQGVVDMRDRIGVEPGPTNARWALAANLRRSNRPAEAIVVLRALDPSRDLGWMSDSGKVLYWRELAWAQHMLGDTTGQMEAIRGLRRMAPSRLATAYFTSLERISAGRVDQAVQALSGVEGLAADAALVAGEIAGRRPPIHVGTPAWVLYQIGTEVLSRGDSAGAAALARRAARWLATRSTGEQSRVDARYLRALSLELAGELDSAWALVRLLTEEDPESIEMRGRRGILAARRGDRAEATATDSWLARHVPVMPPSLPHLERARIAAVSGERDRALELLETLPFRSHPVDVVFFHSDPAFATLRDDPRWIRMLRARG